MGTDRPNHVVAAGGSISSAKSVTPYQLTTAATFKLSGPGHRRSSLLLAQHRRQQGQVSAGSFPTRQH